MYDVEKYLDVNSNTDAYIDIGKYEEMIEKGRFKVVDFIPKSYDKKRYKCGSVHSLMQNSIPGRGQIKTYMHDTDGMHI